MFSKSNLLATIAGFVTLMLLGFIFYTSIAEQFFIDHTVTAGLQKMDGDMVMPYLMIGSFLISLMMSTIYGKWSKGHYNIKGGITFGVYIGILFGFGMGLIQFSTMNIMDLQGHLGDAVWSIFYYGIAGIVISKVYKMASKHS